MTNLFEKGLYSEEPVQIPDGHIDDDLVADLNVKDGVLNIDAPYLPDGGYNIILDGKAGVWTIDSEHVALNVTGPGRRTGIIRVEIKSHNYAPGHVTINISGLGDNFFNRDIYLEDGKVIGAKTFLPGLKMRNDPDNPFSDAGMARSKMNGVHPNIRKQYLLAREQDVLQHTVLLQQIEERRYRKRK